LDWTAEAAVAWAELVNDVRRRGFTVGILDTQIAATAKLHGLTVATRNVDDFIPLRRAGGESVWMSESACASPGYCRRTGRQMH
jgi:predicted nucleic acid-binding protein